MLQELQRGRSVHELAGATYLQDLKRSVDETAAWCARHLDTRHVASSLRPEHIAPSSLFRSRWTAVHEVALARRLDLRRPGPLASSPADGRFLLYYPDGDLSDGAAEAVSEGILDACNTPPWGTWVAYLEDPTPPDYGSYLLAWIPGPLVELVDAGVGVNPEECIVWLDSTSSGLRKIADEILPRGAG